MRRRGATVTSPASVSRTRPSSERSTKAIAGVSAKLGGAGAVVIVMKKGLPSCTGSLLSNDTSESDVCGRCIKGLTLARRGPVAQTIIGRAKVRTAFHDPAGCSIDDLF